MMNKEDFEVMIDEFGYILDPSYQVFTEEDGYETYKRKYKIRNDNDE